jgi:hypothetical protein
MTKHFGGYAMADQNQPSIYQEIFRPRQKRTYRGEVGQHFRDIPDLTRAEALHWLSHDRNGRSLARERGEPLDVLADLIVEASKNRAATKRKSSDMTSTATLLKTLRSMTESEFTMVITKAAKQQHPELPPARAFAAVFEDPGPRAERSAPRGKSPRATASSEPTLLNWTTAPSPDPAASRAAR